MSKRNLKQADLEPKRQLHDKNQEHGSSRRLRIITTQGCYVFLVERDKESQELRELKVLQAQDAAVRNCLLEAKIMEVEKKKTGNRSCERKSRAEGDDCWWWRKVKAQRQRDKNFWQIWVWLDRKDSLVETRRSQSQSWVCSQVETRWKREMRWTGSKMMR